MRSTIHSLKNYSEINLPFYLLRCNYNKKDNFLINHLLLNIILGENHFGNNSHYSRIYSFQRSFEGFSVFEVMNAIRNNRGQLGDGMPSNTKNSTNFIHLKNKGREIVSETTEDLPMTLSHREYYIGKHFSLAYWSCGFRDIKGVNFFNIFMVFDEPDSNNSGSKKSLSIKLFSKTGPCSFNGTLDSVGIRAHLLKYGRFFLLFSMFIYLYSIIESKIKYFCLSSINNVEEVFIRKLLRESENYLGD